VEAFYVKPQGNGPWPTVLFLHGHQSPPSAGGRDFVSWGVLERFARRGYLAVAVSQPGYGGSTGPADFCGSVTQHAVLGVLSNLEARGYVSPNKIVLEGVSRGALVAGLIAGQGTPLAGVVLISGLYDLPQFARDARSAQAREIVNSIKNETGGTMDALRARSVLNLARYIQMPVLILNGAKDDRTNPDQARRLAEEINAHGGRARAIIYPDFGHQIPAAVRDPEIDPFVDSVLGK
jgi:dipeptidyl aminopeptidase/acylaminoacyl peptidase